MRTAAFLAVWLFSLACAGAQDRSYSVCWWNIENWGEMTRYVHGQRIDNAMKPPREVAGVMAILKKLNPDILGVAEVLQAPDDRNLKILRQDLAAEGLDYPYLTTVHGEDSRIQMVLFSRFPIRDAEPFTQDAFPVTLHSSSTGAWHRMLFRVGRGFLNCRIEVAPGYSLQVMMAHLKSKLPEKGVEGNARESGDAYVRFNEARLLRGHIGDFLSAHPGADLLVMGDFNDLPDSEPIREIEKSGVAYLPLADYLGETWTEHFSFKQRKGSEQIDYLFADDSLRTRFLPKESFLFRQRPGDPADLDTKEASDHRPLYARFSLP